MGEVVRCGNATHCVRLVGIVREPGCPEPIAGGTTVLPKGVRIWRVCCGLNTAADSSLDASAPRTRTSSSRGATSVPTATSPSSGRQTGKGQVCRPCEIKQHGIDAFERSFAATTFLPKGPYIAKEIETLRDRLYDLQETLKGADMMSAEAAEAAEVGELAAAAAASNGDKDVSAARRHAVAESRNGNKGPLRDLAEAERLHNEAEATDKEIK